MPFMATTSCASEHWHTASAHKLPDRGHVPTRSYQLPDRRLLANPLQRMRPCCTGGVDPSELGKTRRVKNNAGPAVISPVLCETDFERWTLAGSMPDLDFGLPRTSAGVLGLGPARTTATDAETAAGKMFGVFDTGSPRRTSGARALTDVLCAPQPPSPGRVDNATARILAENVSPLL